MMSPRKGIGKKKQKAPSGRSRPLSDTGGGRTDVCRTGPCNHPGADRCSGNRAHGEKATREKTKKTRARRGRSACHAGKVIGFSRNWFYPARVHRFPGELSPVLFLTGMIETRWQKRKSRLSAAAASGAWKRFILKQLE